MGPLAYPYPEVVGVAVENKTYTEKPAVGQAIGSALACCLSNYAMHELNFPISVVRGRGPFLSFMSFSFSTQFLDTVMMGEVPFNTEAMALLYPQRPSIGPHLGFNLLDYEGRKKAFEALFHMRHNLLLIGGSKTL